MVSGVALKDRERLFADWGTTVVLREVSQSLDPATGVLHETHADRVIGAICGVGEVEPLKATAGQHARASRVYVVRREDVAAETGARVRRILDGGVEYRIDAAEGHAQTRLTVLRCSAL